MSDFVKIKDDEEYEDDSYYKVKYGNQRYNARLIVKGRESKINCLKIKYLPQIKVLGITVKTV